MTVMEFEFRVTGTLPPGRAGGTPRRPGRHPMPGDGPAGPVADQAELIGMINRVQGLGVELRGIRQLGHDAADPPGIPPTGT